MKKSSNQNSKLYDIRMKYQRAGVIDVDKLNQEVTSYLEQTPALSPKSKNILAEIYDYVGENIEREQYKHFTREQWRKLEQEYVYCAEFTLMDLYDMLMRGLERGKITREQYREQRRKYRPCKYRFCLNYFIPSRKDQVFCCSDCQKRENNAIAEYKRTSKIYAAGTYLPPSAYKDNRQSENENNYRKHERIFEPNTVELISDYKQYKELERKDGNGKRNPKDEERRLRQWRIDKEVEKYEKIIGLPLKSNTKTALIIGESGNKPVKFIGKK